MSDPGQRLREIDEEIEAAFRERDSYAETLYRIAHAPHDTHLLVIQGYAHEALRSEAGKR